MSRLTWALSVLKVLNFFLGGGGGGGNGDGNVFEVDFSLISGAHCFKVDRSPTGSGVTARIALQYHKRQIKLGMCADIGHRCM